MRAAWCPAIDIFFKDKIMIQSITLSGVPTSTVQPLTVNISKNLRQAYCVNTGVQPTATVTFSVASVTNNNTQNIVLINAAVTVTYTPKNGCAAKTVQWTDQFATTFIGAANTPPTSVVATPLSPQVFSYNENGCGCSACGVLVSVPVTITATFPAAG